MMRRIPSRGRILRRLETLERRDLLAAAVGETIPVGSSPEGMLPPVVEFKLDVRQDGQSILDGNRNFNVNVGERFDLEVLASDLRSPFDRAGLSGFAFNVLSTLPTTFRPVVTEIQNIGFSNSLASATGGSLQVSVEGSSETVNIGLTEFSVDPEQSLAQAAEQLLNLSPGTVRATYFENPFLIRLEFLDESLALLDLPDLSVDTSGLTGAAVTSSFTERPAFVDGDPAKGVNPAVFQTALDFRSRSLNGLQFYGTLAGGGLYKPQSTDVFSELLGFGSFTSDLVSFAQANSIPLDLIDFELLSIRVEAVQEASGVEFVVAPIDPLQGSFVNSYPFFDEVPVDQQVYDLDDDPLVAGNDAFALVTASFGAAALPPFQNPNNRFDVNGDGSVGPNDLLALINELTNRVISAPDGSLPDPPPDPIPAFVDVNGDNLVTRDDLDDVFEELGQVDFGDAPTAAQSGFTSSYPTLRSDDGARHITGDLYFGSGVSEDADGMPDAGANADDLDDGVSFAAPVLIAGPTADVQITASASGKVDAWIDFNRDGDWLDAGEQIFDDLAVTAGTNAYTFSVSGQAVAGDTFARFRISTDGVVGPTGRASDGEVEDLLVTLTDQSVDPENPVINIPESVIIARVGGNVVISDDGGVLFSQPLNQLKTLTVLGSDLDTTVTYDHSGGSFVPQFGLTIDGGPGFNTLRVIGGAKIDATSVDLVQLKNFPILDFTNDDASSIRTDASVISELAGDLGFIQFLADIDDRLELKDAGDWRMGDPIVDGSLFLLTVTNLVEDLEVLVEIPSFYTNVIDPNDTNNDGRVSSSDALAVILELGRRVFSAPEVGTVVDPTTLDPWPGIYADQSFDGKVTALDALRVINEITRRALVESEQELAPILVRFEDAAMPLVGEPSGASEPGEPVSATSSASAALATPTPEQGTQYVGLSQGIGDPARPDNEPPSPDSDQVDRFLSDENSLEQLF